MKLYELKFSPKDILNKEALLKNIKQEKNSFDDFVVKTLSLGDIGKNDGSYGEGEDFLSFIRSLNIKHDFIKDEMFEARINSKMLKVLLYINDYYYKKLFVVDCGFINPIFEKKQYFVRDFSGGSEQKDVVNENMNIDSFLMQNEPVSLMTTNSNISLEIDIDPIPLPPVIPHVSLLGKYKENISMGRLMYVYNGYAMLFAGESTKSDEVLVPSGDEWWNFYQKDDNEPPIKDAESSLSLIMAFSASVYNKDLKKILVDGICRMFQNCISYDKTFITRMVKSKKYDYFTKIESVVFVNALRMEIDAIYTILQTNNKKIMNHHKVFLTACLYSNKMFSIQKNYEPTSNNNNQDKLL